MSLKSLFKSRKFYVTVVLLLLSAGAGVGGYQFILKKKNPPDNLAKPAEQAVKPTPEDLSLLIERMSAPAPLTPEQIEEDQRIDAQQVARAQEWLQSADPEQRLMGAEQLSAYPTKDAEKLLVDTLINDSEPEVRSTAARSLTYIKNPNSKTLDALQQALQSDNEEVAFNVVNTLTTYIGREPFGSEHAVDIIKRLKQVAKTGQLQGKTRITVQSFLNDQAAAEGK